MAKSYGLGLVSFVLLVAVAGATQFKVGGPKGWSVPDSNAVSYNQWAGTNRFQIGDQLLFVYPKDTDSVLLVEANAYNTCNTSSYINKFNDGNTVFTLDHNGPYFFISGAEPNCRKNEKLIVVVLADRSGRASAPNQPGLAPSPSSTPTSPLSPPPTTGSAPSPSVPPTPSSSPSPPAPSPTTPSSPPSTAPSPASASSPSSSPSPSQSPPPSPPSSPSPSQSPPPSPPSSPSPSQSPPPSPPSSVPENSPSTPGTNANSPPPPGANGAALKVAGFMSSLGACLGYAMLAL